MSVEGPKLGGGDDVDKVSGGIREDTTKTKPKAEEISPPPKTDTTPTEGNRRVRRSKPRSKSEPEAKATTGATTEPTSSEPASVPGTIKEETEKDVTDIPTEAALDDTNSGGLTPWEDMSEEEKKKKYSKSFELRDKIHELRRSRANLSVLERRVNMPVIGRTYKYIYQEVLDDYNEKRAEYIGSKAWRMLKEKQRLAEEKSVLYGQEKFEKVREGWKWLGEQNLEKLTRGTKFEAKGKINKWLQKTASVRTAISLGLFGVGTSLGLTAGAGVAALSARRVMSGTGTAFASYDFIKSKAERSSDKKLISSEDDINKFSFKELEEQMAKFEARALFSGRRFVRDPRYELLKRTYNKKLKSEKGSGHVDLEELDNSLREKEKTFRQVDRGIKTAAIGIGAIIGNATLLSRFLSETPGTEGVTAEALQTQVESGPLISEGELADGMVEAPGLPDEVLEQAENIKVDVPIGIEGEGDINLPGSEIDLEESYSNETTEIVDIPGFAESVKKGEGLWHAAKRIVENGEISKEQFAKAWSSSASVLELESGETIHISEAGLAHVGDQVIYVPESGDIPAHFEVRDYVGDNLRIGDNQELAEAFDKASKERPEWLKNALESSDTTEASSEVENISSGEEIIHAKEVGAEEDGMIKGVDSNVLDEALEGDKEILKQATDGTLNLAEGNIKGLPWGEVEFITNDRGEIVDLLVNESLSPAKRVKFIDKAVSGILKSDFVTVLSSDLHDAVRNSIESRVLPDSISHAKEAAWRVFQLQETLNKLEKNSEAWLFVRNAIRKITEPSNSVLLGENKVIFNGRLLNTEIFKDIKLPQ